jgi:hypothetical protein
LKDEKQEEGRGKGEMEGGKSKGGTGKGRKNELLEMIDRRNFWRNDGRLTRMEHSMDSSNFSQDLHIPLHFSS